MPEEGPQLDEARVEEVFGVFRRSPLAGFVGVPFRVSRSVGVELLPHATAAVDVSDCV